MRKEENEMKETDGKKRNERKAEGRGEKKKKK